LGGITGALHPAVLLRSHFQQQGPVVLTLLVGVWGFLVWGFFLILSRIAEFKISSAIVQFYVRYILSGLRVFCFTSVDRLREKKTKSAVSNAYWVCGTLSVLQ